MSPLRRRKAGPPPGGSTGGSGSTSRSGSASGPGDYYETGAAAYAPRIPGAADLRRVPRIKLSWLLGGLLLIVLIGVVHSRQSVSIPTSCTTPGLALGKSDPHQLTDVDYALTGPDGSYVLGIDVAGFTVDKQQDVTPVPVKGHAIGDIEQATPVLHVMGCKGHGIFAVKVAPGAHVVELFRVTPQGATQVASHPLTVSKPD